MKFNDFIKELKSNRTITSINIIGYSIALSACLIIGIFVYNQLTYDKFNEKIDRIYRLNNIHGADRVNEATTNHQWSDVLINEMPGIEKSARYGWPWANSIEYDKKDYTVIGTHGDKELFDIFSFPILEKTEDNFFKNPLSIAISESLSHKIFGSGSPIGKVLTLNYKKHYTVTAIFKDIPSNSSVKFDYLTSTNDLIDEFGKEMKYHWTWWWLRTYVLVKDKSIVEGFGTAMKPLQKKYVGDWYAQDRNYYLQPLEKIHLYSGSINGSNNSDISIILVYIFCSAGFLILIISCINYINLSVASFESRKHSVIIKKIIGARSSFLFWQYLNYSILLTFLCILGSIFISLNVIPFLKSHNIDGIDIPFSNPAFWLFILVFGILIGILSGFYPASYISKTVILSNQNSKRSALGFRNGLIIIQFTIAIFLLIAVTTIKKQLHESTKGDLGYSYSSLISFSLTENLFKHFESANNEILKIPGVLATTSCDFSLPGDLGNFWPVQPESANKIDIFHTHVAPNFFEVLNIPIKAKFSEFRVDTSAASDRVVLNETSVKQFGIGESILGKKYNFSDTKMEVSGIVNDFHFASLRDKIKPVQFIFSEKSWNTIIRLSKTGHEKTIADIKRVWEKFETEQPFEYKFVDGLISDQYKKEESLMKLFNIFFLLSMLISVIGLYGMVQLLFQFKVKEVGIRKVNGARISEVIVMLNRDVIKWVTIAFLLACPVAWYAMHKWLENFAYKTTLSWWIFAAAGVIALLIALVTVSFQSWRAATRNPVESLRYE